MILALGISLAVSAGFAGRSRGITKKSGSDPKTSKVTRPENAIDSSKRVIHSTNTINEKMFITKMSRVDGEIATITVEDSTGKNIKVYQRKKIEVVQPDVKIKAGDEMAVPREGNDDFRRLIERYQRQLDQPIAISKTDIEVSEEGVSLDDINKYSDPAETLDEQGIPVDRAGSGEAEEN